MNVGPASALNGRKVSSVPTVQFVIGEQVRSIEASSQMSLLDHALAAGLTVSYSCRRGDCGQCVGMLLAGEAAPIDPMRPLIKKDAIYLCNAVPRNDLTIELPHVPEVENIRVVRTPCKIHELTRLTDDVLEVCFRLPPAARFEFLAGQHIRLTNQSQVTRSYSLACAASADKLLRIHVRSMSDGAFSSYLFESAKTGDLLHLEGPLGRFVLRDHVTVRKTIFLATGTGIAPIHAMLSSLDHEQLTRCGDLFLYWGNRRQSDAYLQAPLNHLVTRRRLNYFDVFSRVPGPKAKQTARHVQDLVASHHPDLVEAQVFAAGNAAMIDDARARSLQLGLPGTRFISDPFTAS